MDPQWPSGGPPVLGRALAPDRALPRTAPSGENPTVPAYPDLTSVVPPGSWASGLAAPTGAGNGVAALTRQRGRAADVVVSAPRARTWSDVAAQVSAAVTATTPPAGSTGAATAAPRLCLRLPLTPTGEPVSLVQVASGASDAAWIRIARALPTAPGRAPILSLSAGSQATTPAAAAAFRRVVTAARTANPGLVREWVAPSGVAVPSATAGYPGDDVVDVVAVTLRDAGTPWSQVVEGPGGLNAWLDFASTHRKRLVLHWAASARTDASWVQNVHNWVRHAGDRIAYESYDASAGSAAANRTYTTLF